MVVIFPDFLLNLTGFFQGKHLMPFYANVMYNFGNLVLHNCTVIFDAERVYWKLQVTKFKNKEVIANSKPQTLEKNVPKI